MIAKIAARLAGLVLFVCYVSMAYCIIFFSTAWALIGLSELLAFFGAPGLREASRDGPLRDLVMGGLYLSMFAAPGFLLGVILLVIGGVWAKLDERRMQDKRANTLRHPVGADPRIEYDANGYPAVWWTDEYPSGLTKGQQRDGWELGAVTLLSLGLGVLTLMQGAHWLMVLISVWVAFWVTTRLLRRRWWRQKLPGANPSPDWEQIPAGFLHADCCARVHEQHGQLWFMMIRTDVVTRERIPLPHPIAARIPWDDAQFQNSNFAVVSYQDIYLAAEKPRHVRREVDRAIVIGAGSGALLVSHWGPSSAVADNDWLGRLRAVLEREFTGEKRRRLIEAGEQQKRRAMAQTSSDGGEIPSTV